jgi:competence protein ComEC
VAAVATLVPAPGRVAAWPGAPAVTALDIGQGDAILLRSPDGGTALVDTGPPGTPAPVLDALRRAGVARLDLLAITHDQRDHSGAAAEILSEVPVGRFLTPVAAPAAERAARRAGVTVVRVGRGDRLRIGGWDVEVLWPRRGDPAPADPNDASLVAVARAPGVTALLTGDAESGVLARLSPPPVDILKVSHHGSADPGLEPLLARLRPRVALVSVGNGNRYGHPDPATLQVLASAGVATVRTDRSGSITARGADGAVAVERER